MKFFQAESEVSQLTRKLHSFEEQLDRAEQRLTQTTHKLEEASHVADERERFVNYKFKYPMKLFSINVLLEQEKCLKIN